MTQPEPTTGPQIIRADIQGLRAAAVGVVLLFHLWPARLPGGYVGVDVFFVISGFLITSHLLAHPPRSGRDLLEFWGRRIRRLLPASLLVLAATMVLTWLVAPETQWGLVADQIRAATLYVVNWHLASNSVDYLAAENAASPVQHFWSLAVEEQFYLVWPLVIALLLAVAAGGRWATSGTTTLGLGSVTAASFLFSVAWTSHEPASAYFITPTRVWELGVGGLLAAWLSRRAFGRQAESEAAPWPVGVRVAAAWLGLAAIGAASILYSSSSPFPGWIAAVPVLGTAAVIAAAAPPRIVSPTPALALRPVQWLGDVSYSVYLWHWPLIVLAPYALGHTLRWPEKLVILAMTLALAGLTKPLVEDPFRRPAWGRPLAKPFAVGAAGMAFVLVATTLVTVDFQHRREVARAELAEALQRGDPCFGAAAVDAGLDACPRTVDGTIVPAPAHASDDTSDAYDGDCWAWKPFDEVKTCTFGDPNGPIDIALVGNSHAGQWLPALQTMAEASGWRITTYLASECTTTRTPVSWETEALTGACLEWADRVLAATSGGAFDLVVTSQRSGRAALGFEYDASGPHWERGYAAYLRDWIAAGTRILVVHDTPFPAATIGNVPDCLAQHADDLTQCSGTRDTWVPDDALYAAARALDDPRAMVTDLTDVICYPAHCDAAVGGVTAYFDGSHISATFAGTLAPFLLPELERALASRS